MLKYSPAKQKMKASALTARYGMINCVKIPDLFSIFISKDYGRLKIILKAFYIKL